jgi:hypothetical protein
MGMGMGDMASERERIVEATVREFIRRQCWKGLCDGCPHRVEDKKEMALGRFRCGFDIPPYRWDVQLTEEVLEDESR